MPSYPLTNFKIQNYYQNGLMCKGAYLRSKIPKIKDGASVINLDEYKLIGTHWIALCVNGNNVTYFNSFGVKCIPKKLKIHWQQKYYGKNL